MESFIGRCFGGGGWIRTNVGVSQQIYSLPPLATRAPLRRELSIMGEQHDYVKPYVSFTPMSVLTYSERSFDPAKRKNPTFAGWGFCFAA